MVTVLVKVGLPFWCIGMQVSACGGDGDRVDRPNRFADNVIAAGVIRSPDNVVALSDFQPVFRSLDGAQFSEKLTSQPTDIRDRFSIHLFDQSAIRTLTVPEATSAGFELRDGCDNDGEGQTP
jgi:hypothetical protein